MKIIIINGPNLNLLGTRETDIYGDRSFESFLEDLRKKYQSVDLDYFQSNSEGEIISKLHEIGFRFDGIVMNGAGYTHTSVAIADAIAAINTPVIEVHISNIHSREEFRQHSYSGKNAVGVITGLGLAGYGLALDYFLQAEK